eukprot:gene3708-4228_t
MDIELGTRVVRGPDWIWNDQDGNEGTLGTVIQIQSIGPQRNSGSAKVLWDNGGQGIYRCGENNACDLLVYSSPLVSKHGVGCDVCLKDVIGISWNCEECPLTYLCTICYMSDKHNVQHKFQRFETSEKAGVMLPPRAESLKTEAKGLFPGAVVVRGPSWEWDDQDGGEGQVGNITEIQEFNSKYRRNVARVQWMYNNGVSNVYRIGHNGKVDLKCIKPASGGFYYKNHLPVLGERFDAHSGGPASMAQGAATKQACAGAANFSMEPSSHYDGQVREEPQSGNPVNTIAGEVKVCSDSSNNSGSLTVTLNAPTTGAVENISQSAPKFNIGDKVMIVTNKETCVTLQAGHGGWHSSMIEDLGKVGTVQFYTDKNDIAVTFQESNSRWVVNPLLLKKVSTTTFSEGATVKLISDIQLAKRVFELHVRDWNNEIRECLGNIGKVTKVFLDGNLRVTIGQSSFIIPTAMIDRKVDQLKDSAANSGTVKTSPEFKLMHAAKTGDIDEVKELLESHPHDVNTPSLEGTPLTAAIFEEREDVVKYLSNKGADINILDKNRHTALHLALSVGNEDIIKTIMSCDKLDTTILSGKSNLDYLQFAAVCGSVTGMKLLLKKFPNLINRPSSGPAPLHYAAISSVELLNYLVTEAGFDINVRDLDQRTPLHVAIMTNNFKAAKVLVELGADVNVSDYRGNTPLHAVVSLQDKHSLRDHSWYSMALKRYVGRKDQQKMENKEIANELLIALDLKKTWYTVDAIFGCLLIKHGADPYLKNNNRMNPFGCASRYEVVDVIRKYCEGLNWKKKDKDLRGTPDIDGSLSASSLSSNSSGLLECRLCRENLPDAKFEPCGHFVTCIECAVYFCKCFACEEDIVSFTKKVTATDCLICDENIADVLFEPCKHMVCCPGCAFRMVRCVYCKTTINAKFDKNHQPLSLPIDAEAAKYDELLNSLKNLEAKVRDIESASTCTICMDRPRNIMFLCGHGTCEICSPSLRVCPICREPIEKKIAVF